MRVGEVEVSLEHRQLSKESFTRRHLFSVSVCFGVPFSPQVYKSDETKAGVPICSCACSAHACPKRCARSTALFIGRPLRVISRLEQLGVLGDVGLKGCDAWRRDSPDTTCSEFFVLLHPVVFGCVALSCVVQCFCSLCFQFPHEHEEVH